MPGLEIKEKDVEGGDLLRKSLEQGVSKSILMLLFQKK